MKKPTVRVGQVWRDKDKRMRGGERLVRVELVGLVAAIVRQIIGPSRQPASRTSTIRIDQFVKRFELVEEARNPCPTR